METKHLVDGYGPFREERRKLEDAGAQVRDYRRYCGISQSELGQHAGMKKAQVCKIEKNGNPTVATLGKMYNALDGEAYLTVEPKLNVSEADFVSVFVLCVHQFAKVHGLSDRQSWGYIERYGGLDFFMRNAEVQLSCSLDELMEDLLAITRRNGGGI